MDILIIRFSSLGDVIMATAVVEALKRNFSESCVYFLTKSDYSQVFESDERIFKVIEIQGYETPFEIIKKSGKKEFDVVIDLHSSTRSIIVSALIRAPQKLRLNKHSLARRFMILSRNRFRRKFDVLGSYLETLKPLGLGIHCKVLPKLVTDGKIPDTVNIFRDRQSIEWENRVIGIAPGGRHKTKMWNEESFAKLADEIVNRGDTAVFIGDKTDMKVVERIREIMTGKSISLAGKIDLSETISVISRLNALVANDSGPMHIAGALDIPFVAVFGPTHPDLGFCPGYSSGTIIHSGAKCSPCSLHGSSPCRKKHRFCMDDITWEKVMDALNKTMGD